MNQIYAYTEQGGEGFPGYLNLSRNEAGTLVLTVRERGHVGARVATIDVPQSVLNSLVSSVLHDEFKSYGK